MNSNTFAQDPVANKTQHFVAIQSGYSRHIVQDDIISPLVYKGSQAPIFLDGEIIAKESVQSLSVCFDYLELTSSITIQSPDEAFYSKNYNAFVQYSYCRKLHTYANWRTSVFAGAEFKTLLNFRDHYYNDYIHYNTGELISDIGLSCLVAKKFAAPNGGFLTFRYNMSIIAYDMLNYLYNVNVAKKLSTDADQNAGANLIKINRPVTVNKYLEFQTEISFVKFMNKWMGVELKHYFQYYHSEKFKNLFYTRYVNNQFLVGIIIKI